VIVPEQREQVLDHSLIREAGSGIDPLRLLPGELLHRSMITLTILRADLHAVTGAAELLAGDEGRAGAEEGVENKICLPRTILNRPRP